MTTGMDFETITLIMPVTEGQTLHDSAIHEASTLVRFLESERGGVVATGWERGKWRTAHHGA